MNFVLDTQLLVWTTARSERLSDAARQIIADAKNRLHFSVISIWEVAIKRGLRRPEFTVEPHILRRELIDRGYRELRVEGTHALAIDGLPLLHKDPFDRMLIAQALAEGITLLTVDAVMAKYPCSVRLV